MIVVTGASGKLGGHAIKSLLEKVPAGQIVAAVRNTEKASSLTKLGVQVREADYTKPETLARAFAGAEKVLLISATEIGQRFAQHQHVIDAAVAANVKLLVYTSILRADTSSLSLAAEHLAAQVDGHRLVPEILRIEITSSIGLIDTRMIANEFDEILVRSRIRDKTGRQHRPFIRGQRLRPSDLSGQLGRRVESEVANVRLLRCPQNLLIHR